MTAKPATTRSLTIISAEILDSTGTPVRGVKSRKPYTIEISVATAEAIRNI